MRLAGRSAIVTGGSTGLGLSIAAAFLKNGASVAICGRDEHTLADAGNYLKSFAGASQRVVSLACDVSQDDEVDSFTARCLDEFGRIEILVNNAAVLGPMGNIEDIDLNEWRRTCEINLYGVVVTTQRLIPHMRANGYGKIINLSGGGAASPRPFFSAYAASKAAVVRFSETVAAELSGTGIHVNTVAPGALNTRMLSETLEAGPERVGEAQFAQALKQKETGGNSLERAAELCVYLASAHTDGITGRLISAVWDAWPSLHERREQLSHTDIYTLRRIVPEDRGKSWA
ncbi:MAG: SDR family oxidoreductase [Acidobacteriaceae bacterium]|nr:SDR family oxidoreductase [Acidobacteriaceae bacterium]